LADWIGARQAAGQSSVLTCSALRRRYRDVLSAAGGRVRFVHLVLDPATLADRMAARTDHFMPVSMLGSQLATLEPLAPDEDGVDVPAQGDVDKVVDAVLAELRAERA
uniref:gluconokinase n=1 Tax=Cellulomonas citrea TaxID=1909423 RepID=UPI0034DD9761